MLAINYKDSPATKLMEYLKRALALQRTPEQKIKVPVETSTAQSQPKVEKKEQPILPYPTEVVCKLCYMTVTFEDLPRHHSLCITTLGQISRSASSKLITKISAAVCTICLEKLCEQNVEDLLTTRCGHTFCAPCIINHELNMGDWCPNKHFVQNQ